MRANSVCLAAALITGACYHLAPVHSAATNRENQVAATTWMQVVSESQYALPARHNFVPLRVVRWCVSASNRLRIEDGDGIFITDCQTGESLAIDLRQKTVRRQQEEPKRELLRKLRSSPRERGLQFVKNGTISGSEATMFRWPDRPNDRIWCDRATGEELYGESWHPIDDRQNGISSVSFNYDHNARLREELFSLQPPPGFKLVE
jgi:hypothetical protein